MPRGWFREDGGPSVCSHLVLTLWPQAASLKQLAKPGGAVTMCGLKPCGWDVVLSVTHTNQAQECQLLFKRKRNRRPGARSLHWLPGSMYHHCHVLVLTGLVVCA